MHDNTAVAASTNEGAITGMDSLGSRLGQASATMTASVRTTKAADAMLVQSRYEDGGRRRRMAAWSRDDWATLNEVNLQARKARFGQTALCRSAKHPFGRPLPSIRRRPALIVR